MIVYIAGPISGTNDTLPRFEAAKREVKLLGHEPVTPLDAVEAKGTPFCPDGGGEHWAKCMKADIHALLECEGIYMLRGWEYSRGARLEHLIAEGLGYEIIYQPELPFA